jgi:hypothetical protein
VLASLIAEGNSDKPAEVWEQDDKAEEREAPVKDQAASSFAVACSSQCNKERRNYITQNSKAINSKNIVSTVLFVSILMYSMQVMP